ncbi:hypothetical protein BDY21DRAFT_333571 [Lineolata rhizophorae]|uniref:Six-hairpin glycosidase-like protein n=1 Tax=Lineolata rhizophorae TaxID=578093 RepID=A0A6A6PA66_9PEZI|nr:hypothetical protein BDY21DRAFT_333571 [Lineolata rhizophorae]
MSNPQNSFGNTTFLPGSFCARKRDVVWANTLLYQLEVLKRTGRYDAFKLKWHPSYDDPPDHWPVPNHLFWDSDVAKWIEGACYFLTERDNADVHAAIEELVDMIRSAQQPDGYLNIHFTVVEPGKRFTNLRDLHELYNAGHLIEAALAHQNLYKNGRLLEPILKYVDLLAQTFGPGENQKHGYPGHEEIELALLRLHQHTENPKHLGLARYFLNERGNPKGVDGRHYYEVEAEARGERENEMPKYYPQRKSYWYQQAHIPIKDQPSIEGHSVRATYMLTAVADLVRLDKECGTKEYQTALERLWRSMVSKKMYLTGGIGAIKQWEGFGIDYFLPQGTDEGGCYSETCAAIGVMMVAERLLQLNLNSEYADVMELCFYNAVLTGMSCDGKQFTYVNQLASTDSDPSMRQKWFTCACCPPNVSRLLGYLGGYFWTSNSDSNSTNVNVHMYGSATIRLKNEGHDVMISQTSDWPWKGRVRFAVKAPQSSVVTLRLRIPGWASEWKITPEPDDLVMENGYAILPANWVANHGDFTLDMPFKTRVISPHPFSNQNVVALARGPLVYCVEDSDNPWVADHFKSLLFDPSSTISEKAVKDETTGETIIALTAHGPLSFLQVNGVATPSLPARAVSSDTDSRSHLHFVPYYFRANRGGRGQMRVGLRVKQAITQPNARQCQLM